MTKNNSDVRFERCSSNCQTCQIIVLSSIFLSSVSGTRYDCIFEFDEMEEKVISCKSTNCIYLLECNGCKSQYVGETVQELRNRSNQHIGSTREGDNDSGNYRIRQLFLHSNGCCDSFTIQVIQKLPGSGRLDIRQENSEKFKIDTSVTKLRKNIEDHWIRLLKTQFPYGINDRIDNLDNKHIYACEYAKFISSKSPRRRTWAKEKTFEPYNTNILDKLIELISSKFHSSFNHILRKLLFPLDKAILQSIKDLYLIRVFDLNGFDPIGLQLHHIIMDMFAYKIKPFHDVKKTLHKKWSHRVICKLQFVNKGIEMLNIPRIFRLQRLKSFVNFLDIKEPTVVYTNNENISRQIFNYNQTVKSYDVPSVCI